MAAMGLSQWSSARAGVKPEAAWNVGVAAVVAVFLISRLLLVAFNFKSFLEYPVLLLALPSLSSMGVLLSAIFVFGYVRWRGVPLLPLLDSFAPSAALLWAGVNLGYLLDGTRDGMPTEVIAAGGATLRTGARPVEAYTLIAALLLLLALLLALRPSYRAGEATGLGLAGAGLAIFFIDFYRLPSELLPNLPIDPAQIIAVAMAIAGGGLLYRVAAKIHTQNEAAHDATDGEEESDAI